MYRAFANVHGFMGSPIAFSEAHEPTAPICMLIQAIVGCVSLKALLFSVLPRGSVPSGHMTFIKHRCNHDVVSTLPRCLVPAALFRSSKCAFWMCDQSMIEDGVTMTVETGLSQHLLGGDSFFFVDMCIL